MYVSDWCLDGVTDLSVGKVIHSATPGGKVMLEITRSSLLCLLLSMVSTGVQAVVETSLPDFLDGMGSSESFLLNQINAFNRVDGSKYSDLEDCLKINNVTSTITIRYEKAGNVVMQVYANEMWDDDDERALMQRNSENTSKLSKCLDESGIDPALMYSPDKLSERDGNDGSENCIIGERLLDADSFAHVYNSDALAHDREFMKKMGESGQFNESETVRF